MEKYQIESELAQHAWDAISHAQHITLLAHLRPDADSLGACSALAHALIARGKNVEVIYPTSTADAVPFETPNLQCGTHTHTPDLIISCDASTDERIYTHDDFADADRIIIDHHLGNEMAGAYRFVHPEASSTCELVYELMTQWQLPVTEPIANILLFGIMSDTLTFRTPNTTPRTLRTAGNLIEAGADLAHLNNQMIIHTDPAVLQLWGYLLSTTQYTDDHTAVWTVCTQDVLRTFKVGEEALAGFIAILSQTIASNITMLFVELADGSSKASLRGKTADVRSIAQQHGGGGHKLAAGISSSQPVSELVAQVIKTL